MKVRSLCACSRFKSTVGRCRLCIASVPLLLLLLLLLPHIYSRKLPSATSIHNFASKQPSIFENKFVAFASMNIFKKIGSFATTSWKEFSEFNDQHPLEQPSENVECNPDSTPQNGDSFELKKRSGNEVITRKKSIHGFFRNRFSKKKLLDDPRSPTIEFQRTPLVLPSSKLELTTEGILSPFNVNDMLATVNSALNVTPKKSTGETNDNVQSVEINSAFEESLDAKENLTVGMPFDWKNFEFNEKVLTESLIVEVSSLEIKNDQLESTINVGNINEDLNASNQAEDQLNIVKSENWIDSNCKIVGCIAKTQINSSDLTAKEQLPESTNEQSVMVTSTPKKMANDNTQCETNKVVRTPLTSIKNSPMPRANGSATKKNQLAKPDLDKQKKKKVTSASLRKLPKAPSTPLTPLFKNSQRCVASHFDKENF